MKIALVQKKAVPNDVKANLDLAVRYMEEAGRAGADLVLFPEMWSIGYAPPFPEAFDDPFQKEREKERKAWISQAVGEDSAYIRTLRETAKRLSVGAVITGMYEGEKGPQKEKSFFDMPRYIRVTFPWRRCYRAERPLKPQNLTVSGSEL